MANLIYQGTNKPIVLIFDDNLSAYPIRANLWNNGTLLKEWEKEDIDFENSVVSLPLTQTETLAFPPCLAKLEISWLNADGYREFGEDIRFVIVHRNDDEELSDD